MTRQQFAEFLGRLILDGMIDDVQAIDLLRRFDTGDLPPDWFMPWAPAQLAALPQEEESDRRALLYLSATLPMGRQTARGLAAWSRGSRARQVNALQAEFESRIEALADRLSAGTLSVPAWQRAMMAEIAAYQTAAIMVGAGEMAPDRYLTGQGAAATRRQAAYLSRFGDQIAAAPLLGAAPMSALAVAHRSRMYGGIGRGLFYQSLEYASGNDGETGRGWVVEYVAMDDNRTCGPCIQAQGYYLPNSGPYPGEVCAGGGNCRCERVLIYDPAIYARLTGQPAPQAEGQPAASRRQPARA